MDGSFATILALVVITKHNGSLGSLKFFFESGQFCDGISDLDIVYLTGRIRLVEMSDDVVLFAVISRQPVQHESAGTVARLKQHTSHLTEEK